VVKIYQMEPGASGPEHTHDQQEIGYVYRGEESIDIEGDTHKVGPEEIYTLDGEVPHRVYNAGDEKVVGINISPTEGHHLESVDEPE